MSGFLAVNCNNESEFKFEGVSAFASGYLEGWASRFEMESVKMLISYRDVAEHLKEGVRMAGEESELKYQEDIIRFEDIDSYARGYLEGWVSKFVETIGAAGELS